ncbi:MAG: ABC transporter ATP-binding protein [Lachnospiraceae bacterium]|nr:ABC transporter ATP-binding protein [Lachnospiraceae bacterium]
MSYIEFHEIRKSFDDVEVLKGVDLDIKEGEFISLLGPSGCGKSTLLRCFAGLEEVSAGNFVLDGADITQLAPQKRDIGMVFQQYSLFPNMTVEQNLAFGLEIKKVPKHEIKERVRDVLEIVGLVDKKKSYPGQLSGGQQQRVALARAIVAKPKVLLLDEPLSAIDAKLRKNLQIEIRRIQKALNITTIFVTHDQDEAMLMSDRVCLVNKGLIEQIGSPVEIYTSPKTKFAASFIGHYNVLSDIEFSKAFLTHVDENSVMAIRPETILISHEKLNKPESYEFKGRIKESRSVGNVLRYHVEVNGVDLRADTLYRSFSLYNDGDEVWISVEKRNCLELKD